MKVLSDDVNRNVDDLITMPEIARIMTERGYPMSAGAVWHTERRALRKIATDPVIQAIAEELGIIVLDQE